MKTSPNFPKTFAIAILSFATACAACAGNAAPDAKPSRMERLDRGVVAVRSGEAEAFVSWRLLGTEESGLAFDVYRSSNGGAPEKLNRQPLANGTHFTDTTADFSKGNTYTVRAAGSPARGPERGWTIQADAPVRQYIPVPLRVPEGGVMPDGHAYTYDANDCSVADLDGDGQYEIIIKWDPANSRDNSRSGRTGNVYLDAYKLDGTFLWRIDLGRNIRAGAHYTQFIAYDLDGDGMAEIACKTADGTIDGTGNVIGDPKADYLNERGFILDGPEFLTIFNGRTGAAMATVDYAPPRGGNGSSWGDAKGNRVDRFLACVAYLDGERPSLVMCRGYYARSSLAAWDWRDGKLTQRWLFDSADGTPGNEKYAGQGAHSVTVGDVDGDGCDEIIYGAAAIDHDGKGLYSTGLGHGDALHMSVMNPARAGQQVWMVHEKPKQYGDHAVEFRDAGTGEIIFSRGSQEWKDVGRGVAADIDPRTKGYEMWASRGDLYDCNGNVISRTVPREKNFLIWWDGDFLRELLDHVTISKWNWKTETSDTLLTDPECASNNGTKGTPCLSGDILGDWREEVIWRTKDNRELRIYTTTIPTEHRLHTLMHDRQYRLAIAWQNTAYNQPPHPSFYLGEGMTRPPKPNITKPAAPRRGPAAQPRVARPKIDVIPGADVPEKDWAPVTMPAVGAIPSFPGAEGAGATTPGGRGGRVIYVTNLDDDGPGSLRAACEAEGPRLVLFQVSGHIALKSPIRISNPYITIAGQTAPGDGVAIKDHPLMTETHDIIVRHLRSRKGDETPGAEDALDVGHGSRNVIFDHCSATWSIDEAFSLSGDNSNITLQYCIIGEALRASTHGKGNHGFGSLCRANGPVTLHHNLYIHNDGRNPRFGHNYGKPPFPTFDFRNNVIYNFGKTPSGITQGYLRINYVNNIIIPGASTADPRTPPIHIGTPSNVFVYLSGNIHDQNDELTANNDLFLSRTIINDIEQARAVKTPFAMPPVKTQTAKDALETVLAEVGATLPVRDAVDARLVNHVRTRTGKMINSQTDVGGWPVYKTGVAPKDTDGDGMPDAWERTHGFNPTDPSDGPKDADGDGYTNVEEYLNGTNPRQADDHTKPVSNVFSAQKS